MTGDGAADAAAEEEAIDALDSALDACTDRWVSVSLLGREVDGPASADKMPVKAVDGCWGCGATRSLAVMRETEGMLEEDMSK